MEGVNPSGETTLTVPVAFVNLITSITKTAETFVERLRPD
jgi:hypothetical protein